MKYFFTLLLTILFFNSVNAQIVNNLSVSPNPFSTTATIQFQLLQSDTVSLRVVNVFGSTLESFFQNTYLPTGNYSITLTGDSLIDGLYMIVLNVGDSQFVKKIVYQAGGTSIENLNTSSINIFPNPTDGNFTITTSITIQQIEVINLLGEKVYSLRCNTPTQTLHLTTLSKGVYFLRIKTADGLVMKKMVIE